MSWLENTGGFLQALIAIGFVAVFGAVLAYATFRWGSRRRQNRLSEMERNRAITKMYGEADRGVKAHSSQQYTKSSIAVAVGALAFAAVALAVGLSWQSWIHKAPDNRAADIRQQTGRTAPEGDTTGSGSHK